jgi:hypothetical protein
MAKFPVDASKRRVLNALKELVFTVVREAEHCAAAVECRRQHHADDDSKSSDY